MGEAMAFGSLLKEGTHVRLSGGCHDCQYYSNNFFNFSIFLLMYEVKIIIMTRFIIQVRMSREEPSPIVTVSSTIRSGFQD